jgi:hypothetical protein
LRLRLPTPGLVGSPHVHSSFLAVPGELRRFANQMHPPLGPRGDKRRGIAPVVLRGLPAPFGHRLPWGGGPCSVSCYFLLYAVAAHQLHTVAFLPVPAPFGHPLPWGGGPCSVSCYFLLYAVAAHQLHTAWPSCAVWASSPLGWWSLFCFVLFLHVCGRSPPAASRQLSSPMASPYMSIFM